MPKIKIKMDFIVYQMTVRNVIQMFIMIMELPCVTIQMIKHGATFNTMKITMFAGLQIGIHATTSPIDGI